MDEARRKAGIGGGAPHDRGSGLCRRRALEGGARVDDGTDQGAVLFVEGQIREVNGNLVAGVIVDVWHADTRGG